MWAVHFFLLKKNCPKIFNEPFSILNDKEKRVFLKCQHYEEIRYAGFNVENCENLIHGKEGIKDGLF